MSKINAKFHNFIQTNDGNQYLFLDNGSNEFTNNCPWSSQDDSDSSNLMTVLCSDMVMGKDMNTGQVASRSFINSDATALDAVLNTEFSYSNGVGSLCYQDCCEFQEAMVLNPGQHFNFAAHLTCA